MFAALTVTAREVVDARKMRFERPDLPRIFREGDRVIVAKGKNVHEFLVRAGAAGENELAERVLGPSGNLRAPTARVGRTFWVGFHAERWRAMFAAT